ncbi:MAG TPA: LON peptidase substrate-binding domain-containing protein [Microbacteriaceae bacterium]|nr:LON peptidase substrate-binding domain-containing protein [Microbacteriaceae bacterium]
MAFVLPQFPVGQVTMPNMPVALRVFEPRYLNLMGELMGSTSPQFGIPLYSQAVEPGEAPNVLTVGTLIRVSDIGMRDDFVSVTGMGRSRYVVTKWLEPGPYPRAEVEFLPELVWDERFDSVALRVELEVRNLLSRASRFGELPWDTDAEISDDRVEALWQLAGMLPIDARESHNLLAAESLEELCEDVLAVCEAGQRFLDRVERESESD